MVLTNEEAQEVRSQLREQIQDLPAQQKEAALAQINSMSNEALEELVIQQREQYEKNGGKTIYRMIVSSEVPSVKVGENSKAIAVLEINPVSDGHTLIIPKEAIKKEKDIPKEVDELAKSISEILKTNFNAKNTHIIKELKFGEVIINVFASFDNEITLKSPRDKKNTATLEEIAKKFLPQEKKEVIKILKEETQQKTVHKLPRRIP